MDDSRLPPVEGVPDPEGGDCVTCGRCCHHGPRTVHLLESDDERMGSVLLERYTELDGAPAGVSCGTRGRGVEPSM